MRVLRERAIACADLPAQTITTPAGGIIPFAIDSFRKESLLGGLDPIGRTLRHEDDIVAYEGRRQGEAPWLLVGA